MYAVHGVRSRAYKWNCHIDVVYADDRHGVYIRLQVWIHYFRFGGEHDVYLSCRIVHQGWNVRGVLDVRG